MRPPPPTHHALLALALLTVAACERSRQAPPADTVALVADSPVAPPVTRATSWDPGAGEALFVAGATPQQAIVVFPELSDSTLTDTTTFDVARVGAAAVDLFSRAGRVGSAQLAGPATPGSPARNCTAWPAARLAGAPPAPWSVGFAAGSATAIPLDSIEDDPPADSARLAADVTRLAAALPGDTAPAFRSLPLAVRTARRFTPAPGVDAVVAQLVRKVNQEARPYEQQIVVVGERDAGSKGKYAAAYFERVAGQEETIETSEVLAAVRLGPAGTPTLVLGRDYGDGTAFSLVERVGDGRWRLRWSSAYAGC